jgi:hypothetical protein
LTENKSATFFVLGAFYFDPPPDNPCFGPDIRMAKLKILFRLRLQFRKSHVGDEELAAALRAVLRRLEAGSISSAAA